MGADPGLDAPLVVGRRGTRLAVRSYQARMQHWVKAAGLEINASPHWLRHTFGQRLIESSTANEPLLVAQQALGHRSITSTQIYTKPTREQVQADIDRANR